MIAQYIIDWGSVLKRVRRADDLGLERMRSRLAWLREKIARNGVLIVDGDSRILEDLNVAVQELLGVADGGPDGAVAYSDMRMELELYITAYENSAYRIDAGRSEDSLEDCIKGWVDHARRIAPSGVRGGVVITDRDGVGAEPFMAVETWESYPRSDVERLRYDWSNGLAFDDGSRADFEGCLRAFAATSAGEVVFVDKFWSAIGMPEENADSMVGRIRRKKSTKLLLAPFCRNPEVGRIDIITTYPRGCDCFCTELLKESVASLAACRGNSLHVNVMFVEPHAAAARFHNRFLFNDVYTVSLHDGMDICDCNGKLIHFQISLYGPTKGRTRLDRGHINDHGVRNITELDVDIPPPFVVYLRQAPAVTLSLNG